MHLDHLYNDKGMTTQTVQTVHKVWSYTQQTNVVLFHS